MAEEGFIETIGLLVEYSPVATGRVEAVGLLVEYTEDVRQGLIEAVGLLVEYTEFAVSTVAYETLTDIGGSPLTVYGTFIPGVAYAVTVDGEPSYSGVLGQGYEPICETGGRIDVITPPLPVGGPYDVAVTQLSPSASDTLSAVVTVDKASTPSPVLNLRASAGDPRKVGPRSIRDEPL